MIAPVLVKVSDTLKERDTTLQALGPILYQVYTNTDLDEGEGLEYVKHYCSSESTAIRLADSAYVQSNNSPVVPLEAVDTDKGWAFLYKDFSSVPPTGEDLDNDKKLKEERELKLSAKVCVDKAVGLGFTKEEILLIKDHYVPEEEVVK